MLRSAPQKRQPSIMERSWLGESGGLGSSPHSAKNWLGCWPSLALCIFLFEMRLDLWPSNFFFSSAECILQRKSYLGQLYLGQIEAEVHWWVGGWIDPGCSAPLRSSHGSSEEPQSSLEHSMKQYWPSLRSFHLSDAKALYPQGKLRRHQLGWAPAGGPSVRGFQGRGQAAPLRAPVGAAGPAAEAAGGGNRSYRRQKGGQPGRRLQGDK